MTNYNDGNWHGWNGGECPVHPKSKVEVVVRYPDGLIRSNSGIALSFRWEYLEGSAKAIAFRVVKEHREPREWWVVGPTAYNKKKDAVRMAENYGGEFTHVREVLE